MFISLSTFVDFDLKMQIHAMILTSALLKEFVLITLSVKTIKEVLIATVLTVTKEITVATSMSVIVQLVVPRTPYAQILREATSADVLTVFMETVTCAFRANARTVTAPKTKSAFQQRPQVVNVKTASNSTTYQFAKISMSVNRPSVMIKPNV